MSELPAPANKPTSSPKGKKLLDQLRDAIRAKHYSYRTEQIYLDWCKRYTLRVHQNKRHPAEMGVPEIQAFITHLATERNVAASTQNPCTEPVEVRPSAPRSASSSAVTFYSKQVRSFRWHPCLHKGLAIPDCMASGGVVCRDRGNCFNTRSAEDTGISRVSIFCRINHIRLIICMGLRCTEQGYRNFL